MTRLDRSDWLLAGAQPMASDDPAEVLARMAASHGALAIEAISGCYIPLADPTDDIDGRAALQQHLADPGRVAVDSYIAGRYARLAVRFADAALRLNVDDELTRDVRAWLDR